MLSLGLIFTQVTHLVPHRHLPYTPHIHFIPHAHHYTQTYTHTHRLWCESQNPPICCPCVLQKSTKLYKEIQVVVECPLYHSPLTQLSFVTSMMGLDTSSTELRGMRKNKVMRTRRRVEQKRSSSINHAVLTFRAVAAEEDHTGKRCSSDRVEETAACFPFLVRERDKKVSCKHRDKRLCDAGEIAHQYHHWSQEHSFV